MTILCSMEFKYRTVFIPIPAEPYPNKLKFPLLIHKSPLYLVGTNKVVTEQTWTISHPINGKAVVTGRTKVEARKEFNKLIKRLGVKHVRNVLNRASSIDGPVFELNTTITD